LKSFVRSETSADREEREFHFAQQRENNNNENNNKARKKGRRSREKRGVLREIKNRIFKSLSPLLSVFSWRGGRRSRGRFFCSKFEKKTLGEKRGKKEKEKEKKKYRLIREERQHRDNRAAAKVAAFVSRIIFVSRIRRL